VLSLADALADADGEAEAEALGVPVAAVVTDGSARSAEAVAASPAESPASAA
jgi:hypothetical protein